MITNQFTLYSILFSTKANFINMLITSCDDFGVEKLHTNITVTCEIWKCLMDAPWRCLETRPRGHSLQPRLAFHIKSSKVWETALFSSQYIIFFMPNFLMVQGARLYKLP